VLLRARPTVSPNDLAVFEKFTDGEVANPLPPTLVMAPVGHHRRLLAFFQPACWRDSVVQGGLNEGFTGLLPAVQGL
jgi:hypothetical protein